MKCECGAYLNPLWNNCQICGKSVITKKEYGHFTFLQIKNFLGDDWELYKDNTEALLAWANLLHERQLMERGVIPKDFIAITHCACCGDVFVPPDIANNGSVNGCCWCWNKARGLPIPNVKKA